MIGKLVPALIAFILVLLLALVCYATRAAWRTYRPPRPKNKRTPADLNMPCETLSFPALDGGAQLSGWLIPAPAATRRCHTVVLCHQLGAHKGFGLSHAQFYHRAGFDVIAFDLRNHGDSGYDPGIGAMSRRFTNDVRSAVRTARDHIALKGNKISVHAFSFSTFPALVAGIDVDCPGIDSVILDSGPTLSPKNIARGFFDTFGARLLPRILRLPMIYPVFRELYTAAVIMMLATDWPSCLRGASVPSLFIAGENDTVASPAHVAPVVGLVTHGTLVVIPGAGHLATLRSDRQLYVRTVLGFLSRQSEAVPLPEAG
jgi:uncharacterized protein